MGHLSVFPERVPWTRPTLRHAPEPYPPPHAPRRGLPGAERPGTPLCLPLFLPHLVPKRKQDDAQAQRYASESEVKQFVSHS